MGLTVLLAEAGFASAVGPRSLFTLGSSIMSARMNRNSRVNPKRSIVRHIVLSAAVVGNV
jgi:hypothetical protein